MRKILNIAHRGFTKTFPENTLEAFDAAIQIPVDAVEFDINETADHEFVVFHGPDLHGTDIARLSLDQIRSVKLKGKFKIPTLQQTLDLCRKRVMLLIDIKRVRSVERFVELLRAGAEIADVMVFPPNQDLISKLSDLAPDICRGIAVRPHIKYVKDAIEAAGSTQSRFIALRFYLLNSKLVEKIHAKNLSIFVGIYAGSSTGLRDIRSTLELDIEGILSDFPDLVAKELSVASYNVRKSRKRDSHVSWHIRFQQGAGRE